MKDIISKQYMTIVRYIEVIIIISLIPLLYNYIPIDKKASETLYIDAANIDSMVTSLEKNGYTVTLVDKIMMQVDKVPKSDWYRLDKNQYGRFNFFKNIHKQKTETMELVVYAGETYDELISRLANDMKLDKNKLYNKYKTLSRFKEADIFANRYTLARKADENATMTYLFDQSRMVLDTFIKENFRNVPDTFQLKVLLTIASILQKESNSIKEMPIISSVIYNRLAKNMKLQMDATLNYGKYSHKIVTSERIKSDTSYYNTYKYKGLPPYPLGTITEEALHAAMFPAKSDHLFFMLKPDGSHEFCASYDKHLENIKIFRAYQKKREEERKKQEAIKLAALKKAEEKTVAEKQKVEAEIAEVQKHLKENNESNYSKPSSVKL